jgi:methylated-DNA-[protein]-cysteine S-methyltransferase
VAFLFTGFYIFTVRITTMDQVYIKTPLGITCITGDASGVSKISISDDETQMSKIIPEHLIGAINQLQEYFSGSRDHFDFKINPAGTDFQKRVWEALLKIPFGTTTSYHALSKQLGDIKAIRAVASANGKNPLWIVVPCHRVIGSDGSLTGYAGGLWHKKWLLEHECPPTQGSLF